MGGDCYQRNKRGVIQHTEGNHPGRYVVREVRSGKWGARGEGIEREFKTGLAAIREARRIRKIDGNVEAIERINFRREHNEWTWDEVALEGGA